MNRQKGLGMGLDALLGASDTLAPPPAPQPERGTVAEPVAGESGGDGPGAGGSTRLPLNRITAGQYQPRKQFDDRSLEDLAESVRQHGLIQPILVRALTSPDTPVDQRRYEIIAGERRYRACAMAGMDMIPAIIRDADNEQALALALIENIQRKDLNAIEEARAIARLLEEFGYSHDAAAKSIGRSRSATTNLLRLLNLGPAVQQMVIDGRLDMGHARAVLTLSGAEQIMAANRIIEQGLSVREAEALVSKVGREQTADEKPGSGRRHGSDGPAGPDEVDPDITRLETRLADMLATGVQIKPGANARGKLIIDFVDAEHFDGLLHRLGLGSVLDG